MAFARASSAMFLIVGGDIMWMASESVKDTEKDDGTDYPRVSR